MIRFALILCFVLPTVAWTAEPVHRFTLAEYEATLDYWSRKHSDIFSSERIGESREGMGIYLLKITDPDSPRTDKQHSLITALHGGPERSGTTGCLRVIEWLLSDDEQARLTREKQEVWLIPIINPYAYFTTDRFGNSLKIDPYTGGGLANWDLETLQFRALDRAPEMGAFLETVDQFQPEAHLDLHGTGMQEYPEKKLGDRQRYQGQIMTEITGSAYSNYALRPWDWRITEAMIKAGADAGFPSDRFEADAQRLLMGVSTAPLAGRHWRGRAQFYSAQYGYAKYHTLIAALEIAWEDSALARTKAWLNFGNVVPEGECESGYPVDRMKAFVGHFVTASGANAEERRRSRARLWQCQESFSQGFLYPQTDGRILYAVTTNGTLKDLIDTDSETFLTNLETHGLKQVDQIREFIESGPEIKMAVEKGRLLQGNKLPKADGVGIGFRLRIPAPEAMIDEIRLNGQNLPESRRNGYHQFRGHGYTQVQINLDETRAAEEKGVFVISLRYTPKQKRSIGWAPPAEVLDTIRESGEQRKKKESVK